MSSSITVEMSAYIYLCFEKVGVCVKGSFPLSPFIFCLANFEMLVELVRSVCKTRIVRV